MFTVCPKCALTLVVTAADLRVAQGYVRCGRCSSVFNALARLADDRQAAAPGVEAVPASSDLPAASVAEDGAPAEESDPQLAPQLPEESPQGAADADAITEATEEETVSDDALEFDPSRTDVTSVFVEQPPDPNWTAATGSFKAMVAANQESAAGQRDAQVEVEIDADFLASMLTAEPASPAPAAAEPAAMPAKPSAPAAAAPCATDPADPQPAVEREPPAQRHARPAFEAAAKPAAARAPARRPPPPPPPPMRPAPPAQDLLADEENEGTTTQVRPQWRSRLEGLGWPAACGLAVLILLAQIANHSRDDLAASPRLGRTVTALYRSLGVHLVPRWDLRAYDVRQLGADVDPSGTITVRASIKNAAQQPQPLPLLRVTLQDRFGNRIASNDVAPRFYLPHSIPASSYLSAGQRIDAQMGFVDPGANAVGFELDACLPATAGGIACANDLATR